VHDIFASLRDHDTEILVVDDDSPDGTWHIAEQIDTHFGRLRVIRRQKDRGLRASLAHGIELARGETICWMDADFSMPPVVLPELVDELVKGADIAVGSRYVKGGGDGRHDVPMHRVLSWILTSAASCLLVPRFHDYTSGFIAVRKSALDRLLPLEGDYGEYFMALIYRAFGQGLRIVEVPYVCRPRRHGESKTAGNWVEYFTRGWGYVRLLVRLRMRGRRGE
jgi:dolichol-phosphate mannosyltransferase